MNPNYINFKPDVKIASSAKSALKGPEFKGETILLYPSDVGENPRQSSWMLFARHSISGAKVKERIKPVMVQAGPPNQMVVDKPATEAKRRLASAGGSNSLLLSRRNISKTGTFIGLYMPPSINVKYQMEYNEGTIGVMGEALYGLFKDYQSGSLGMNSVNQAAGIMGQGLEKMGVNTVDKVIPGAKDLFAIEQGAIITPRTEMMFRGIGRRDFSFTFTFIPKDRNETKIVRNIVNEFKVGMSPNFTTSGSVREMTIPDVFSIQYMHVQGPNSYLNKIGKCYLKSMDVTYGGDKFVTYNKDELGAPPQRTTINLAFQELEIMDRTAVEDGF